MRCRFGAHLKLMGESEGNENRIQNCDGSLCPSLGTLSLRRVSATLGFSRQCLHAARGEGSFDGGWCPLSATFRWRVPNQGSERMRVKVA